MKRYPSRAFTIIELLVVVSIIALLVGILLPAIGRARDGAQLTKSVAQMKQIGTALHTYSSEYNDKHVTWCVDNLGSYGDDAGAFAYFAAVTGDDHPRMWLGLDQGVIWYYVPPNLTNVPIDFAEKYGVFRTPNAMILAEYLNGRFYDQVWYAPKDSAVMAAVEPVFELPSPFPGFDGPPGVFYASYCLSPAAMFSPTVLGRQGLSTSFYIDPYTLDAGFRAPTVGQAQYPDLKTWVIEHHWLQNRKRDCNAAFTGGTYDGCEPYYFNASLLSNPVTLFFDGHIDTVGQQEAVLSNRRVLEQADHGLWSKDTPMGGDYGDGSPGGYYMDAAFDFTSTSYHILTIDGIKGRDITSGN